MDKKEYEFIAELHGDMECFCFKISTEEYIKLFGKESYEAMKDDWFAMYGDIKDKKMPDYWNIYPGTLFGYKKGKYKFKITMESEQ